MNRRDFTRGLASFGLIPAVPLPSLAASATKTVAAASAEHMYFMGWYTARLNKTCSPDMLVRELNVQADVASEIFNKLVKSRTISAPDALGTSRTLDPLAKSFSRSAGLVLDETRGELRKRLSLEVDASEEGEPCEHAEFEDIEHSEEEEGLCEGDAQAPT
jgi:hypothetical protein